MSIPSTSIPSTVLNPATISNTKSSTSNKGAVKLQEEVERKPFPQFNAFRPFVMHELTRRKSLPNSFVNEITPVLNAPFARMTSCAESVAVNGATSDNNYRFFTLGLHGYFLQNRDVFEASYGNGQDVVGYAHRTSDGVRILVNTSMLSPSRLTQVDATALSTQQIGAVEKDQKDRALLTNKIFAHGTHPIPGITDIRISRLGIGTAINATVQWTCYNQAQLEYLRQHFFNVGNHVVLEWGQNSSEHSDKVLDFGSPDIMTTLVKSITDGRKYIIDNWCRKNQGNYDFMVGSVANFQVNLDGRTGVYTCITNIVSVSEQMWGLNNHVTFVPAKTNPVPKDSIKTSTITDFFKIGGLYDSLIRHNMSVPTMVAGQYSRWAADNNGPDTVGVEKPVDFSANFMSSPDDFTFVSWEFLTRIVTTALFHLVDDPNGNTKSDLEAFISFFEEKHTGPDITKGPIPIDEHLKDNQQIWVGDNPHLVSNDPNTMLIIRKNNIPYASAALKNIGAFDDDPQGRGYRGKLSKGIWLNSEMIRQSFLSTNTFGEAFMNILTAMNNATANYWKLRVYFDEEVNRMRIIDEGHTDFPDRAFYKFNVGGQGECLGITFDSAFPPALVTQMQLIAKLRTEPPAKQEELLAQCPLIGTTSTYAFSVNWTNLTDALQVQLAKLRDPSTGNSNPLVNTQPTPDVNTPTRQIAQVVKGKAGPTATGTNLQKPATPVAPAKTPANTSASTDAANAAQKNSKTLAPAIQNANLPAQQAAFNSRLTQLIAQMNKALGGGGRVEIVQKKISQAASDTVDSKGRNGNLGPIARPVIDGQNPHVDDLAADLTVHNADGSYSPDIADQLASHFAPRPDTYGGNSTTLNGFQANAGTQTVTGVLEWVDSAEVGHSGHVQLPRNEITSTTPAGDAIPRSNPDDSAIGTSTPNKDDATLAAEQKQTETVDQYIKKFGNEIILLVNLNSGAMITEITQDGYNSGYKNKHPNSFVSPFPTTTAIGLTILGISGISVTDGFYVDKLPFIFEKYGCFQVTSIEEAITKDGWLTTVRGYFKLIYIDGYPENGGAQKPVDTLPPPTANSSPT